MVTPMNDNTINSTGPKTLNSHDGRSDITNPRGRSVITVIRFEMLLERMTVGTDLKIHYDDRGMIV